MFFDMIKMGKLIRDRSSRKRECVAHTCVMRVHWMNSLLLCSERRGMCTYYLCVYTVMQETGNRASGSCI